MADTLPEKVSASGGRIMAWVKKHPWVAGVILAGVAVVAYIAYKNSQAGATTSPAPDTTGLAGTGADTGAAIPGAPISDVNLPIPQPIFDSSGGGGGGGKRAAVQPAGQLASSLFQANTMVTSPDLASASINDYMWAAYQASITEGSPTYGQPVPDVSVPPNTNIFAGQYGDALIQQVSPTPTDLSGVTTTVPLAPTAQATPDLLGVGPGEYTPNPKGPSPIQQQAAAQDVQSFLGPIEAAISSIFKVATLPGPTAIAAASIPQAPNLAAGLVNQINEQLNGRIGTDLPTSPSPEKTAGVSGAADLGRGKAVSGAGRGTPPVPVHTQPLTTQTVSPTYIPTSGGSETGQKAKPPSPNARPGGGGRALRR